MSFQGSANEDDLFPDRLLIDPSRLKKLGLLMHLLYRVALGSGRSVAWLALLPWAQEVASSNLAVTTIFLVTTP
jgi:hypothetical protein